MTPTDTDEGQHLDYKSLREIHGPKADLPQLAQDCVCLANSAGGRLLSAGR